MFPQIPGWRDTATGRSRKDEVPKAWIAVVDAGPLYDSMVARLLELGVPTLCTVDRALRMFEAYGEQRLATTGAPQPIEGARDVPVSAGP
ncbi:MAG: hypothetical protein OEO20_00250 [Gemmatimonadota bacterium]|nr:hypothetical protein [Gemmatimonadota bacterium]MDH3368800.1 hypothetical protein [Gemmatimonadota bacterium]MDH3476718.1 hypothetical protein [Gemmatimonadota bacterium]MDH3571485.1 hypothetical protein [Gemmatimonadota bacterium]MDH5551121.1 hypothetical protein [Gemmatimonadota bacterium]